jgi:hypothetical protein
MKLEIILRIHDGQNIHGDKPRYINIPKKDPILGCLTSLINSANVVTNAEISFFVLHIQFEKQRDPHINHLDWWNKYSKLKSFEITYD